MQRRRLLPPAVPTTGFALSVLLASAAASVPRLVDVTFAVRVTDQFGAEIAGSAVFVPTVGLVLSGASVTVPEGTLNFGVIPKILDTDPFIHGPGLLARTESRTVDSSTTLLEFGWPVQQVQLNLVDQNGVPITGLNGLPSIFEFSNSGLNIPFGTTVALPITDDAVFPTIAGIWADGYNIKMVPAVLDTNAGGLLQRLEEVGTTEVNLGTTHLTFVWPVQQVQLNLVDQNGVPITGLNGLPSIFEFSNSGLNFPFGTTVALPITDDTVFPTIAGIWADGYNITMAPAVLDRNDGGLLQRREEVGTTEVVNTTTALVFTWITVNRVLTVVDPNETVIPGSQIFFAYAAGFLSSGDCVRLPITDNAVYPSIAGVQGDGYKILIRPGSSGSPVGPFDFELSSPGVFSPSFVSIGGLPVGLRFAENPQCGGQLPDADADGIPDVGDNCPGVANADQADSDGDGVGDVCDPDDDNDGLLDGAEANTHGTNPLDPDTDDDGLLDGTEVDMAMGSGCPNPLNSDSDGDGLTDGAEVASGTNPCNPDTDGDGVNDGADPLPLQPGVPCDFLASMMRSVAASIDALSLSLFNGPNANANQGRRNSLSSRVQNAANHVCSGAHASAIAHLNGALEKVDGLEPTPDWMVDSAGRTALKETIELLIALTQLLG